MICGVNQDEDDDSDHLLGGGDGGSADDNAAENRGTLKLDATCAPSDITYPTDSGLLNKAREELEKMIDTLYPYTGDKKKPRTYKRRARKEFLSFSKQRKPRRKAIHKITGKQLGYVRRDLAYIDRMLEKADIDHLSRNQQEHLETIRILYTQQKQMYDEHSHSIPDRIVSISKPFVHPIVRGKTKAPVEFGPKVSISLIDGLSFVDKIGWDPYNEATLLKESVETYKRRFGFYPAVVQADKIYRNHDNRNFCKERGIRLSGPKLGRAKKGEPQDPFAKQDSAERNWVEGKFGEVKNAYGLDRLLTRLQETSESAIHLAFIAAEYAGAKYIT